MNKTDKTPKHYWLYVLLLNEGKYYVGKTSKKDPLDRVDEHLHGFYSAQWVKKYGFLDVVEIVDIGTVTDEQAERLELERTLEYMRRHGYQNVRGGILNYSGKYLKVGSYYLRDEEWKTAATVLFLATLPALVYFTR